MPQPAMLICPATVAVVVVMAEADPVVNVGAVSTPLPLAATLMSLAPPPPTTMSPL